MSTTIKTCDTTVVDINPSLYEGVLTKPPSTHTDVVSIRVSGSPGAYSASVEVSSPEDSFSPVELELDLASDLENAAPQPVNCAF